MFIHVLMDKILENLYYNPETGYASVNELYDRASKLDRNIKLANVKKWLSQQPTYTLHKYAKKRFERNKVLVSGIDEQWQMDLVDLQSLSKQNNGYKFLLTCIDVFSKFAWAIPIKNKTSGSIIEAFDKILLSKRTPQKIQTDAGTEFLNKDFQSLLKKHGIIFFTTNSEMKASVVERFNRTLKERMWRYFTQHNTFRYLDVLTDFMQGYNTSKHRTIGVAPAAVNILNEKRILNYAFKVPSTEGMKIKFQIGDKVRISKTKGIFEKGYLPKWSDEVFVIAECKMRKPPVYVIKDQMGEIIDGIFYEPELQKIEKIDDVYVVEKIIKSRKRSGKTEHFVKWKGYPTKFNSWVTNLIKI